MNKPAQSILITLLGVLLIAVTMSGRYTSYVIPRFGVLLAVGGAVLIVLGLVTLVVDLRNEHRKERELVPAGSSHPGADPEQRDGGGCDAGRCDPGCGDAGHEQDGHGDCHDHERSRAPWLLLVPVLVLLVVAPAALGADAVTRYSSSQAVTGASDSSGGAQRTQTFAPLPPGDPPELTLQEFVLRALYDQQDSVTNTPVAVVGFIVNAPDGYTIARIAISCCAADGDPIQVYVPEAAPYPENTWVRATVTAVPGSGTQDNDYVPQVVPHSIQLIDQPVDPYLIARYG